MFCCILEMNGIDPIMATFKICDANADNGLIMEEIKQDECKKTLNKIFGLTTDMLQDTFIRLDENMDKVISKEEGQAASQSLERNIIKEIKETLTHFSGYLKLERHSDFQQSIFKAQFF